MMGLDQIPREAPHPDNNVPLDLSNPFELIVYVIIPITLIVLYFFLRKKRKTGQNSNEENNE
ncbi:MAG: adenylosuccinate synthetase [Bacteroidota bacterium]